MGLGQAVLGVTGIWHGMAAWHFVIYPERTLRRTTQDRPVSLTAIELLRFLGGINAALAIFAVLLLTLPSTSLWVGLVGFSLLNLSQYLIDLRVARMGMIQGSMFRAILWGDGFFCLLNTVGAILASRSQ